MTEIFPESLHSLIIKKAKTDNVFIVQFNIILNAKTLSTDIDHVFEIFDMTNLNEQAKEIIKAIIRHEGLNTNTSNFTPLCLFYKTVSDVKNLLDPFNTKFNHKTSLDLTFDIYAPYAIEPEDIGLAVSDSSTHFHLPIKNKEAFLIQTTLAKK